MKTIVPGDGPGATAAMFASFVFAEAGKIGLERIALRGQADVVEALDHPALRAGPHRSVPGTRSG